MNFVPSANFSGRNKSIIVVLLNVILPLLIGGLVYVLFRPSTLNVFKWIDAVGLTNIIQILREKCEVISISKFIVYNLPMGLWTYAFCFSLLRNFRNQIIGRYWIWSVLVINLTSEIGQLVALVPGTFDVVDIVTSMAFFFLAWIMFTLVHREVEKQKYRQPKNIYAGLIGFFFVVLAYGSGPEDEPLENYSGPNGEPANVEEAIHQRKRVFRLMFEREPNKHEIDSISAVVEREWGISKKRKGKRKKMELTNDSIKRSVQDTIPIIVEEAMDTVTSDTIRH